ncbi:hypothetical protein HYT55_03800 [Candidatus Woesearchaeota archaeon]|nr:hypothetical protein [Candidatus Woesearchaeota archaeon]
MFTGKNLLAQIGHVWQCGSGKTDWGVHYFLFGDHWELTGEVNGRLTLNVPESPHFSARMNGFLAHLCHKVRG